MKIAFQGTLVMLSMMAGTIFPFMSISLAHYCGLLGHVREWINPLWGFIFGFGWFAIGVFADERSPFAQRFGGIVWPLATCFVLFVSYGRLYGSRGKWRGCMLVAIAMSFVVILPSGSAIFRYVPTYSETLHAVYWRKSRYHLDRYPADKLPSVYDRMN